MTLSARELDEITVDAVAVAQGAGRLLLDGLNQPKEVTYKGIVDLVTQYDTRAEAYIRKHLEARYPDFGILGEEEGEVAKAGATARWIIDPLDGTTNFCHGHPFFAVSIGLEVDGELCGGVVRVPVLGHSFWARKGGGAFRDGVRLHVSTTPDLDQALLATGFPYDRRTSAQDNTKELATFLKRIQGIRRCGSAAIDLALVAQGIYDGFWEPKLRPWDFAAGVVLVQEAGGIVTNYQGNPLELYEGWLVAGNSHVHPQMLEVLKTTRG